MSTIWKFLVENVREILGSLVALAATFGAGRLVQKWLARIATSRVREAVEQMELRLARALAERQTKAELTGATTPLRRRDDVRPISQEALDHAAKGVEIARGLGRFSEDLVAHMQETLRRLAAEAGVPLTAVTPLNPSPPPPAEAVCQDAPAAATSSTPEPPPAA